MKDIETDADLIEVIDDLKYHLKIRLPYSRLRENFNDLLNDFIKQNNLGNNLHHFAVLKQDVGFENRYTNEEIIKRVDSAMKRKDLPKIKLK